MQNYCGLIQVPLTLDNRIFSNLKSSRNAGKDNSSESPLNTKNTARSRFPCKSQLNSLSKQADK